MLQENKKEGDRIILVWRESDGSVGIHPATIISASKSVEGIISKDLIQSISKSNLYIEIEFETGRRRSIDAEDGGLHDSEEAYRGALLKQELTDSIRNTVCKFTFGRHLTIHTLHRIKELAETTEEYPIAKLNSIDELRELMGTNRHAECEYESS